ncbi:hypothetical protein BHE74_00035572 [Ensete ventricosum]|nr:hypothetical protein BHE74_00035572 [Ensete ventricosum]
MLIKDGNQGDLDHEAAATVEEEDGSSNVGYGSVEMVAAKVWLRQRDEGAAECTTIAEEGNSSMEREIATGHV